MRSALNLPMEADSRDKETCRVAIWFWPGQRPRLVLRSSECFGSLIIRLPKRPTPALGWLRQSNSQSSRYVFLKKIPPSLANDCAVTLESFPDALTVP